MQGDRDFIGKPEGESLGAVSQSDRLMYAADLLSELQALFHPELQATLVGLLALSQAEARRLAQAAAG